MTPNQIIHSDGKFTGIWNAVLLQALDDATASIPNHPRMRATAINNQRIARAWFRNNGADFREVCSLAGLDSDWIRANALKRIAEADAGTLQYRPKERLLTHNGETRNIKEWAAHLGINEATIHTRLTKKLPIEQVLYPGKLERAAPTYKHNGKNLTLADWSKETGISVYTLKSRIKSGWPIADALTLSTEEAKRRSAEFRGESFKLMSAKRRASLERALTPTDGRVEKAADASKQNSAGTVADDTEKLTGDAPMKSNECLKAAA